MRILVTGASGMLGSLLVERWRDRFEVLATGGASFPGSAYRAFDLLTDDYAPLIAWARPDVLVHCAAWTALDACEADPERAYAINGRSVGRLLDAAPNARMIYISSDAVLGDRTEPLGEDAVPQPLNAYARSKLLGETLLLERGGVVVRTIVVGWNRDPKKQSFVEWLVRAVERREPITLFDDGLFNPIAAPALADELETLLADDRRGIWHVTGREAVSKHAFGVRLCERLGLDTSVVREGRMADVRLVARRSADQRLAVAKYQRDFGRSLPTTAETIDTLVQDRRRVTEQT